MSNRRHDRWALLWLGVAVGTLSLSVAFGPDLARRTWLDDPDESPDWDERWFPYAPPPPEDHTLAPVFRSTGPTSDRAFIAAGVARVGDDATPSALPNATVALPAFRIDRTEVTVGDYARFVEATGREPPRPSHGDESPRTVDPRRPVTGVTHDDAMAYCRYVGARLPTSLEWERAARGPEGRRYPWGDTWEPRGTNTVWRVAGTIASLEAWRVLLERARAGDAGQEVGADSVGTNARDVTPEGVADLHGNVREWTASGLGSAPGLPAILEHPLVAITRGVGFVSRDYAAPSAARFPYRRDWSADDLGFRCAVSEP